MRELPVPSLDEAQVTFTTSLDGVNYGLEYLWNARDDRWYLSIYDAERNPLSEGKAIAVGLNLLATVTSELAPPGELYAVVNENWLSGVGYGSLDPGYEDLANGKVRMIYVTAAEASGAA